MTTEGFGVLNAPVDERCNCSYSAWSSLGRRGGAGPVAKGGGVRTAEVEVNRRRVSCGLKAAERIDCIV